MVAVGGPAVLADEPDTPEQRDGPSANAVDPVGVEFANGD
jgi:hypothetical protein